MLLAGMLVAGASLARGSLWQLPGRFVDEYGTVEGLRHWQGEQTLVSMEYSDCKFVCSSNWRRLVDLQAEADRQHIVLNVLIVSLDPEHDTPAAWRDYRKVRGLTRSNWNFLTGDRSATDRAVNFLGVKWWYFNESIMHDFRIIKVNRQGEILAVMDNFETTPKDFLTVQ